MSWLGWSILQSLQNLVRNLQYGPRTQLARGIYYMARQIQAF